MSFSPINASRQQIAGDPPLAEELLRAFHSTNDPAPLTELLRLFSTVALMPAVVGFSSGLTARDTLEKLAFILENSLEEKLLARVSC